MKTILAIVLVGFLVLPAMAQTTTDQFLVTPGKGIGAIEVGMNITDAVKILGTPKPAVTGLASTVLQAPPGTTVFVWPLIGSYPYSDKDDGLAVVTDTAGKIFEVETPSFDKRYHTADGFRVFDHPQAIVAKFGEPDRKPSGGTELSYVYDRHGVAFGVDISRQYANYGLVNGMRVFAPKT